MMSKDKTIMLKPMEPEDSVYMEKWHYSGDYDSFFVNAIMLTREQLKVYSFMRDGQGLMIWKTDTSQPVGFISLYDMRMLSQNVKIGILIDKDHQKSLVGYHAMLLALEYAFNQMNFEKVIAEVSETNDRVIAVIENGGFRKECVMEREAKDASGKLTDVVRYCIFKEEFQKRVKDNFYL